MNTCGMKTATGRPCIKPANHNAGGPWEQILHETADGVEFTWRQEAVKFRKMPYAPAFD